MSEIETTAETESAPGGIDRRAALKKVAVGGAVAWTAPTLLSSKVSAQTPGGFCTPKCFPTQAAPAVTGCTYCIGIPDTNQFRQAAGLTFAEGSGAGCPCGGDPVVNIEANNLIFRSLGGGGRPTGPEYAAVISGGYLVVGAGGGVLSSGTYLSTGGSLDVTTTCVDRDGDLIQTTCAYLVEFTFQPNSGACNQVASSGCSDDVSSISNVLFALAAAGCTTLCNGVAL